MGSPVLFCSSFVQSLTQGSVFPSKDRPLGCLCCHSGAASSCHPVLSKLRSSAGPHQSRGCPKVPPRGSFADPSLLSPTWATVGVSGTPCFYWGCISDRWKLCFPHWKIQNPWGFQPQLVLYLESLKSLQALGLKGLLQSVCVCVYTCVCLDFIVGEQSAGILWVCLAMME